MKKEERERLAALDQQLDHWAATNEEQKALVKRLAAEQEASGETARLMARGEAAQRRALAFEDARRKARKGR